MMDLPEDYMEAILYVIKQVSKETEAQMRT